MWKKGPLPADTYGWGGVVPLGLGTGFMFADFQGDHVVVIPGENVLQAHEIAMYDNSLELPPNVKARINPPVINSWEWEQLIRRRGELIFKKNRDGLSNEEQAEYERLEKAVDVVFGDK